MVVDEGLDVMATRCTLCDEVIVRHTALTHPRLVETFVTEHVYRHRREMESAAR